MEKNFIMIEYNIMLIILLFLAFFIHPKALKEYVDPEKENALMSAKNIMSAADTYYKNEINEGRNPKKLDLSTNTIKYEGSRAKKGVLIYNENGNIYGGMYINSYCVTIDENNKLVAKKTTNEECKVSTKVLSFSTGVDTITLEEKEYEIGSVIGTLPVIERENYNFLGWYYNNNLLNEDTKIETDIVATAKWELLKENGEEIKIYVVTFDYQLVGKNPTKREYRKGNIIGGFPKYDRKGYKILGWYTKDGKKYENNTKVTSNITLYAKWEITPILRFDAGGDAYLNEEVYEKNETIASLPTISKYNYKFLGWYYENGTKVSVNDKMTKHVTVYAKWEFTPIIKFNTGIYNKKIEEKVYTKGSKLGTLPTLSREGYKFLGWYKGNIKLESTTIINDNIYAQAKWELMPTLTFVTTPSNTKIDKRTYNLDDQIGTLPTVTASNNIFLGWYYKNGNKVNETDKITENTTIYAKWELIPRLEYVTGFDSYNITTKSYKYGSKLGELPVLSRSGYTFLGWYYNRTGEKVDSNTIITKDMIIYAKWKGPYENGKVYYYNPETNKKCRAGEVRDVAELKTGCMKWYSYLDDGSNTVHLILDHNTTNIVTWNDSSGNYQLDKQLANDTKTWNESVRSTARIIEMKEVVKIVGNEYWSPGSNVFSFQTNNRDVYYGAKGTNNFAWLFDNTQACEYYGCNVMKYTTHGYWTTTKNPNYPGFAWAVNYEGRVFNYGMSTASVGIRPVITVSRNVIS